MRNTFQSPPVDADLPAFPPFPGAPAPGVSVPGVPVLGVSALGVPVLGAPALGAPAPGVSDAAPEVRGVAPPDEERLSCSGLLLVMSLPGGGPDGVLAVILS
ncbi:hypothetical protein C4K88_06930 [Arthrobacter pityocampae]|uniref:Uncharacterized protein n=1 Tax=Arthrobacter pityocampae TaxID=547334 RepID=A0A2S5IXY0_9MICC|nr:hypothetical protein C4K88_06930 [Arthrobacter pityocampae]